MTFRIGHTRLRLHPLLPLLWLIAGLGGVSRLLAALCALLLHESGHLMAARLCGASIAEVEITPLGGVITLEDPEALSGGRQFLLTSAGPLFSLIGCLLAPALFSSGAAPFSFCRSFAKTNLLLLLFNLLPVLPLDGGHMLRAILRRFFPESAVTRFLIFSGEALGILLCAVSLFFAFQGMLILSPAFCGLYLIYASAADGRRCTARYVTALIARRQKLENHAAVPVEAVAAGENTPVGTLLRRLSPGKYHIVLVLAPDGVTRRGMIEEKEICEAALSRPGALLGDVTAEKKGLT
ncbi:MAG: M50 family metallopeptidase [Clostridia bacterium]|nr:M50 family metallopeptidase [Clostridia bacterium]